MQLALENVIGPGKCNWSWKKYLILEKVIDPGKYN